MKHLRDYPAWRLYIMYPKHLRTIILGSLLSVVATVLYVYAPQLLADMANLIEQDIGQITHSDTIRREAIIVGVICVIAFLLSTARALVITKGALGIAKSLRDDLFDKTCRIPYSFFLKMKFGDISSRIVNDCMVISTSAGLCISRIITAVQMMVGQGIMMAYTNTRLALIVIVVVAVGIVILLVMTKRLYPVFQGLLRGLGDANSKVIENVSGHRTIVALNAEKKMSARFGRVNDELGKCVFKSTAYGSMFPSIMGLIRNAGYATVCGVGALMYMRGQVDIGTILAFLIYLRLFIQPITDVSEVFMIYKSMEASAVRMYEILDAEELEDGEPIEIGEVKGAVDFEDVRFQYSVEGKNVIDGFTLSVKPGTKVAIVGFSGSGKTTLMNVLMRFFEMNSGDIKVDGISIRKMTHEQVYSMFSLVSQENWICEGTYRDNLAYGRGDVSDEKLLKVCEGVGLLPFIKDQPDGLDTKLDDVSSISAGRKQQISIARAIVNDAPILVLDEATSAVDIKTEEAIIKAVNEHCKDRTSFIIAHRLSTIRDADIIIVLKDGKIKEAGTSEELMLKQGFYYDLNRAYQNNTDILS